MTKIVERFTVYDAKKAIVSLVVERCELMDGIALMIEEHKNIKRMLEVIRKQVYQIGC